jgi:hypothetical protein
LYAFVISLIWATWHAHLILPDLVILILFVGIAQWYSAGLRAGWSVIRVLAESGNFSLHHRVQTGSGAHSASYQRGTRGSFPGSVKLTTHLHLVPRSRLGGNMPLLTQ